MSSQHPQHSQQKLKHLLNYFQGTRSLNYIEASVSSNEERYGSTSTQTQTGQAAQLHARVHRDSSYKYQATQYTLEQEDNLWLHSPLQKRALHACEELPTRSSKQHHNHSKSPHRQYFWQLDGYKDRKQ